MAALRRSWVNDEMLIILMLIVGLHLAMAAPLKPKMPSRGCPMWPTADEWQDSYTTTSRDLVIYSQPRSMSNRMVELLNQLGVIAEPELFNLFVDCSYAQYLWFQNAHAADEVVEVDGEGESRHLTLQEIREGLQLIFTRGWRQSRWREYQSLKIFPNQLGYLPWTEICEPNSNLECQKLKIIFLARPDYFAGTLSWFEATQLNQWMLTRGSQLNTTRIDLSEPVKVTGFARRMLERCVEQQLAATDLTEAAALGYVNWIHLDSAAVISADPEEQLELLELLEEFLEIKRYGSLQVRQKFRYLARRTTRESYNKQGRSSLDLSERVVDVSTFLQRLGKAVVGIQLPVALESQLSHYYSDATVTDAVTKCRHLLETEVVTAQKSITPA